MEVVWCVVDVTVDIQLGLLCVNKRYASLSVIVLVGRDSFTSVVYEAGSGAQDISARETIRLSIIFAIHLSSGFPSTTQRVLDGVAVVNVLLSKSVDDRVCHNDATCDQCSCSGTCKCLYGLASHLNVPLILTHLYWNLTAYPDLSTNTRHSVSILTVTISHPSVLAQDKQIQHNIHQPASHGSTTTSLTPLKVSGRNVSNLVSHNPWLGLEPLRHRWPNTLPRRPGRANMAFDYFRNSFIGIQ